MPEEIELRLTIPPELGKPEEVIAEVRTGVEEYERKAAEERRRTGARVLGRRGVLEQSWKASPATPRPPCTLRPRFAGHGDARIRALLEYGEFLAAYREARRRWLAKERAKFPPGTYWLARFAAIPLGQAP
jgi:hypothetical protein